MRYFNHRYVVSLLFISVLFLSEGVSAQESEGWSEANATVLNEVSVYLKKPEYIGLFGLGSLFTNKLEVVYANYKLPEGARIRLLEKWDTGARGYRYVRFQWQHNGKRKEGWTWAGKKPNYWLTIQPDNATEPFASHISHSSISIPGHRFSGIGEQFLSFFVGKAYGFGDYLSAGLKGNIPLIKLPVVPFPAAELLEFIGRAFNTGFNTDVDNHGALYTHSLGEMAHFTVVRQPQDFIKFILDLLA